MYKTIYEWFSSKCRFLYSIFLEAHIPKLSGFCKSFTKLISDYRAIDKNLRFVMPETVRFNKKGEFKYYPLSCEFLVKKKVHIADDDTKPRYLREVSSNINNIDKFE